MLLVDIDLDKMIDPHGETYVKIYIKDAEHQTSEDERKRRRTKAKTNESEICLPSFHIFKGVKYFTRVLSFNHEKHT